MFSMRTGLLALGALGLISTPSLYTPDTNSSAGLEEASRGRATWEVSVTNLTRGQIFSPPVVAVHSQWMDPLWTLGEPASAELAGVAEDADNPPLIDAIRSTGQASDVQMITGEAGPIMPGETASARLTGNLGQFNRLSMAGMLVITNDAFFGLNGVSLPRMEKAKPFFSPAYDAGSEANNELCAFIPGPPCNSLGERMIEGAEGYVFIHAGIHGVGDLAPASYDWRDKVAVIRVRRVW
ncbi:MAG: spondin domain-containing protein [Planctomycetota bacterium]|jgi:hypothetical protein